MADADITPVTPEQIKAAMNQISMMALSLRHLCSEAVNVNYEMGSHLMVAAGHMSSQIGCIADRCLQFDVMGSPDNWLMSPAWEEAKEKSHV